MFDRFTAMHEQRCAVRFSVTHTGIASRSALSMSRRVTPLSNVTVRSNLLQRRAESIGRVSAFFSFFGLVEAVVVGSLEGTETEL